MGVMQYTVLSMVSHYLTHLQEAEVCNVTLWFTKNLHKAASVFYNQQTHEVVTYISLWTSQLDIDRLNEGWNVDLSPCAALVQI